LLVAGIRNTYGALWELIRNDFTSQNGFLTWVAAVAVVGGLGYIPRLRSLSIAFMTLLLLVLVLANSGIFNALQQFVQSGGGGGIAPITPPTVTMTQPAPNTVGSAGLSPLEQINNNLQNGFGNGQ